VTLVNPPTRPFNLVSNDQTPVSTTELWLGMCATVVVMTLIGLWFIGAL